MKTPMRKLYFYGPGSILLAILVTLIVWQMSFDMGAYGPANAAQTFAFWSASTLIFLLTVTLGFMLFREFVKLYFERQRNKEGSRIKTKLVRGALALSLIPVAFLAAFGYQILNRNLDKWFSRPAEGMRVELIDTAVRFEVLERCIEGHDERDGRCEGGLDLHVVHGSSITAPVP